MPQVLGLPILIGDQVESRSPDHNVACKLLWTSGGRSKRQNIFQSVPFYFLPLSLKYNESEMNFQKF